MDYQRTPRDRRKLGDILRQESPDLTEQQIGESLAKKKSTERLGEYLVRTGQADPEAVARSLAAQTGFPYLALTARDIEREWIDLLPRTYQKERALMVLKRDGRAIWLAMADPRDSATALDVEARTGLSPRIWVASDARIDAVQGQIFAGTSRIRYRLILDVQATVRLHPPAGTGPEVAVRVRDMSLSGLQLAAHSLPAGYLEALRPHERNLQLVLAGVGDVYDLGAMLAWTRAAGAETLLGLEFFDRSKEEVRRLYRVLLMKGEHQVSKPPKPAK